MSCFGYQGFSNAKFGRIEVHEAINAYARDILLMAKEHLEAGGWRVLHGIVDSIWVTPRENEADRSSLRDLAEEISAEVGISLEYEGAFEWVTFCPRRDGGAGALTGILVVGVAVSRPEMNPRYLRTSTEASSVVSGRRVAGLRKSSGS